MSESLIMQETSNPSQGGVATPPPEPVSPQPGMSTEQTPGSEGLGRCTEAQTDERHQWLCQAITADVGQSIGQHVAEIRSDIETGLNGIREHVTTQLKQATQSVVHAIQVDLDEFCGKAVRQTTQRPIIHQLIALEDRIRTEQVFLETLYQKDQQLSGHVGCRQLYEQLEAVITSVRDEVRAILWAIDVSPIQGTTGGRFDPRHHQVVRVKPTADPQLDGHIIQIVRPGYLWRGTVLRPEQVVVFKLRKEG